MKKSRLLFLPALALCLGTAACEVDDRTPIAFWHTFSDVSYIKDAIAVFEQEHPQFRVDLTSKGGYDQIYDATMTGISGGAYPDLVVAYPDHVADYIHAGVAVDWNPYMDHEEIGWTDEEKAKIVPAFFDEGQHFEVPGTYTMPFAKSTECLYFNEVLFNFTIPGVNGGNKIDQTYLDNLTWDELFLNLLPKLVELNKSKHFFLTDDKIKGLFGWDSDDNFFITLCKQFGIGYTALDQDTGKASILYHEGANKTKLKEVLKMMNGYHHADLLATKGTCKGEHTNKYFIDKKFLFSVGSTGGLKYHLSSAFNVGVANLPRVKKSDPHIAINQGPSLAMLNNGRNDVKVACWELYKTLASAEWSAHWSLNTGYMPINEDVYTTTEYADYIAQGKPEKSTERLQANIARYSNKVRENVFLSPAFIGSATARKQADILMTRALQIKPSEFDSKIDGLIKTAYENTKKNMPE